VEIQETEVGSGQSLHAKLVQTTTDTLVQDMGWNCAYSDGSRHYDSTNKLTDTIEGDEHSPTSDSLTETKVTHTEYHSNLTNNRHDGYGSHLTANASSSYDETSTEQQSDGQNTLTGISGSGTETQVSTAVTNGPRGSTTSTTTYTYTRNVAMTEQGVRDNANAHTVSDTTGTDPQTGAPVNSHYDSNDPSTWPDDRDWFAKLSDFSAAVADKITCGLTSRVRKGLDIDEVNYNSSAYKAGEVAGEVLDLALTPVNPCGKIKLIKYGVKALSAAQATGHLFNAKDAIENGDLLGAADELLSAKSGFGKAGQNCFTAGTPVRTPGGARPIEDFRVGDLVLTRFEGEPDGPVRSRRVVETFVRVAPVLNVHAGGRLIETTREHPFYVEGKGWRCACELQTGDLLVGSGALRVRVDGVADSGRVATVYNVEVEADHTFFVGAPDWGFDLWVHNLNYLKDPQTKKNVLGPRGKKVQNATEEHHGIPWDNNTFKHHEHDLVQQAGVDLKTYAKNLREVTGHKGRHSASLYHTEIKKRLDAAHAKVEGKGQKAAQRALDKVIKNIWTDIGSGKLPLYRHKDVLLK
jgi:hypothetical protein